LRRGALHEIAGGVTRSVALMRIGFAASPSAASVTSTAASRSGEP
jgi:hypothetical protein